MKKFLLSLATVFAIGSAVALAVSNPADFNTFNGGKANSAYSTYTTTDGWTATNCAIVKIGDDLAPTLNGKTTAVGSLTSPTLTGGIGTLSFSYENTFSESNGVSLQIDIKQNGEVVDTETLTNNEVAQSTEYTFTSKVFDVEGEFVIEITNLSPSNNTGNKDRVSVWNLSWTAYGEGGGEGGGETPDPDQPEQPEQPEQPGDDNGSVTFDFINNDYGMTRLSGTTSEYNPNPCTVAQSPVTIILNGNTRLWSDGLRGYKESNFEISTTEGNITEIVITYKNATAAGGFAFADNQAGEYSVAGSVGTWIGSSNNLKFNCTIASGNQAISTIEVKYGEGGSDAPSTPVAYNAPFAGKEYTLTVGQTLTLDRGAKYPTEMKMVVANSAVVKENDSNFTLTALAAGTTTVDVTWTGDSNFTEGETSFTVTVKEASTPTPGGESGTYTFDFANNDYGLERKSGSANDGYLENGQSITSEGVTLTFEGGWRLWTDGLREYYRTANTTFTVSVDGGNVTGVDINAKSGAGFALTEDGDAVTSWTGNEEKVTFYNKSTSNAAIVTLTVTYTMDDGSKKAAGLSFPESKYTVILGNEFTSPVLSNPNNLAVTYTSSDEAVAKVSPEGIVEILATGTTTITATSEETEEFNAGKASYTLTVNPSIMTVAEALAILEGGQTEVKATVKGIVSEVSEISAQYGNATYFIKDALTDAEALQIYRGYWLDGEKFTSEDQIAVGGTIVVSGTLVNYNGKYQFTTGSMVVEYTAPEGGDQPGPDQPEEPKGTAVMFDFTDPASLGFDVEGVTELDLSGLSTAKDVVTVNFESAEGANTPIRLYSSSGAWAMRFYKDTEFSVSVPGEEYQLNAIEFNGTNLGKDWSYSIGSLNGSLWTPGYNNVFKVTIGKTETGNNPVIKSMTVYYDQATGVDGIQAEDGEAVYFNLQGVKVANPEKGLYIKVVGNKASKVIL